MPDPRRRRDGRLSVKTYLPIIVQLLCCVFFLGIFKADVTNNASLVAKQFEVERQQVLVMFAEIRSDIRLNAQSTRTNATRIQSNATRIMSLDARLAAVGKHNNQGLSDE